MYYLGTIRRADLAGLLALIKEFLIFLSSNFERESNQDSVSWKARVGEDLAGLILRKYTAPFAFSTMTL